MFGELSTLLKLIFELSFKNWIFSDSLKIVIVTCVYKSGDSRSLCLHFHAYAYPGTYHVYLTS